MSGFLYYLEGHQGALTMDQIHRRGLDYAFDRPPVCAEVSGPDGKRGLLCYGSECTEPPPSAYMAKEQNWHKSPGTAVSPAAPVWVGLVANSPPTPSLLRRETVLPGRGVTLADGNEWIVPAARSYGDDGADVGWYVPLPRQLTMDAEGRYTQGDVVRKYQTLMVVAERAADAVMNALQQSDGKVIDLDLQAHIDDAVKALQYNYRISSVELIALLGALTLENVHEVLLSLIDWYTYIELLKKKSAQPTRLEQKSIKWLLFHRWRRGLAPGYRPTIGELMAIDEWPETNP